MSQYPVAIRYARTLYAAAKEAKSVDKVCNQLERLQNCIESQPVLRAMLGDPTVSAQQKSDILVTALEGKMERVLQSGLEMMIGFNRAHIIHELARPFSKLRDEDQGFLSVTVRSVRPLSGKAMKKLQTILEKREQMHITLANHVDESLIGGIRVELDYRIIDASVKRQLSELRHQLSTVRVA